MASIHRQKGKPNWFCSYRTTDGKQHFRSTKLNDKKAALEVCRTWERAARIAGVGALNADSVREVITRGVANVFEAANQKALPRITVRGWCKEWLEGVENENAENTFKNYSGKIERFLEFLGTKADADIAGVDTETIGRFRDQLAKKLKPNAVNAYRAALLACFGAAAKRGYIAHNPVTRTDKVKQQAKGTRRDFTLPEICRLLDACDPEWRGAVLFAIYTAQRLGDISNLTWRAVDTDKRTVSFTTDKTGREMVLPLAKPLIEHLSSMASTDDPDAPLFPTMRGVLTGTLSNRFHAILLKAKLAKERTHGKGQNTARELNEVSFHSLRHSAATLLAATGATDIQAGEFVGQDSEAVRRHYRHLKAEDLRAVIDALPDVTATKKGGAK